MVNVELVDLLNQIMGQFEGTIIGALDLHNIVRKNPENYKLVKVSERVESDLESGIGKGRIIMYYDNEWHNGRLPSDLKKFTEILDPIDEDDRAGIIVDRVDAVYPNENLTCIEYKVGRYLIEERSEVSVV